MQMVASGAMSGATDSPSSASSSSSDSGPLRPSTPDRSALYSKSVPRDRSGRFSLDADAWGTPIRSSQSTPIPSHQIVLPQKGSRRPGKLSQVTMMGGPGTGDYFGLMSEMVAIAEDPKARPTGGAGGDGRSKGSQKGSSGSGSSVSSLGGVDQQAWNWKRMGWTKTASGPLPLTSSSSQMEDRLVRAKALAGGLPDLPPLTDCDSPKSQRSEKEESGGGGTGEGRDGFDGEETVEWSKTNQILGSDSGTTLHGSEVAVAASGIGQHKSLLKELEEMREKAERAEQSRLRAEHKVMQALADADRSLKEVEEQNRVREMESAQKIKSATQEASKALAEAEAARREAKKTEQKLANAAETWAALEDEARKKQKEEQVAFRDTKRKAMMGKCTQYTYEDLQAATDNFHPSKKVGEGGFGTVYGGMLHHTRVAIKVLKNQDGIRAQAEFEQELEVLGDIHHPHMVMLLGCCPSHYCLVYEFMGGGSLEDRLSCSDGAEALPWYARVRICAEVASALLVLHTHPVPIVHRDLKPANILLDKNLVAKLGDVGLAKFMMTANPNQTCMKGSRAVGTYAYLDPEFQQTGEFGPKSDVYAFGIVLLDMLTGRKPQNYEGIEVALDSGNGDTFATYLDSEAGDWPKDIALQMAMLAVKCSEMRRKKRPDLGKEVMPALDTLRTYALAVEEEEEERRKRRVGPEVVTSLCCPITQEVMQHPVLAADGYTYEQAAIVQWFKKCNLSPMTDIQLPHIDLVPNHALRAMIQEHLRRHR